MATSAQARKLFKSWHGLKEGPQVDKKIINPWAKKTGRKGIKSKTTPWCAISCASCLLQIGVKYLSTSAGCTQQLAYYKKKKRFKARGSKPAVGDLVFYNFNKVKKSNVSTHMGMVTSVNYKKKGFIYVIEGNKGDKVAYRHVSYSSASIIGFGKPYYK